MEANLSKRFLPVISFSGSSHHMVEEGRRRAIMQDVAAMAGVLSINCYLLGKQRGNIH